MNSPDRVTLSASYSLRLIIHGPELRKRVHFVAGDFSPIRCRRASTRSCTSLHSFEIWSLSRNTELLRKCSAALPPGGRCIVYNFVSDEAGTGPMSAGLVSPYFLILASRVGMTYSPADMEKAVRAAGFWEVERIDNLGFSHALVVGRR